MDVAAAAGSSQLPAKAVERIDDPETELMLSAASIWEGTSRRWAGPISISIRMSCDERFWTTITRSCRSPALTLGCHPIPVGTEPCDFQYFSTSPRYSTAASISTYRVSDTTLPSRIFQIWT